MSVDSHDRETAARRIADQEEWILERLFEYARRREYTRYSPTLKAAWQTSVVELSRVVQASFRAGDDLELHPDADYTTDPSSAFGILEARRHRSRGVNLAMFLGLFKYYRQAFHDFLGGLDELHDRPAAHRLLNRVFDRIEIAFCTEWAGTDAETQVRELAAANRQVVNEKNRLLAFFEGLEHPSVLIDRDGNVRSLNHAAVRLLEGCDSPGGRYYDPDRKTEPLPFLQDEIRRFVGACGREAASSEIVWPPGGQARCWEARLHCIKDVNSRCDGVALTLMDVTRRRQNQQATEAANDALERTLVELRSAQEQLVQSEKMAAIGQLAAGIAHEINNPVGFVKVNVNLLAEYAEEIFPLLAAYREAAALLPDAALRRELEEKAVRCDIDFLAQDTRDMIEQSRDGLERIVRIVSDLKNFSRQSRDEWEVSDLNTLLESTLTVVHNQVKYHATVVREFAELPPCECLPGEIAQVAMNLIVNASHAIGTAGTITIATGCDEQHVWFSVSDDGAGIAPEVRGRIFEPFFTTKPVGQGTGLGLSVSHGIVRKHHGAIEVESEPGAGATFRVTLPRRQPAPLAEESPLCLQTN